MHSLKSCWSERCFWLRAAVWRRRELVLRLGFEPWLCFPVNSLNHRGLQQGTGITWEFFGMQGRVAPGLLTLRGELGAARGPSCPGSFPGSCPGSLLFALLLASLSPFFFHLSLSPPGLCRWFPPSSLPRPSLLPLLAPVPQPRAHKGRLVPASPPP